MVVRANNKQTKNKQQTNMMVRARFYDCLDWEPQRFAFHAHCARVFPKRYIFTLKISHSSRVHTKLAIFKLALQNRKQRRGTEPITT